MMTPDTAVKNAVIRVLTEGQATLVLGAGVTMQAVTATDLSWTALLRRGVSFTVSWGHFLPSENPQRWQRAMLTRLRAGGQDGPISVGHEITTKLGGNRGGQWKAWLDETFSGIKPTKTHILDAIGTLARNNKAILTTTNYDTVIEDYLKIESVNWTQKDTAIDVVRRNKSAVLHLHGAWNVPETVVLGVSSYDSLLRDEFAQTIQRTIATMNSLIFIGCGDGVADANVGGLIRWTERILSDSPHKHFILLNGKNARKFPRSDKLFAVNYGDKYEDLPFFIEELTFNRATMAIDDLGLYSGDKQADLDFPPLDFITNLSNELDRDIGLVAVGKANAARAQYDRGAVMIGRGSLSIYGTSEDFWHSAFQRFGGQSERAIAALLKALPTENLTITTTQERDRLLQILRRRPGNDSP